MTQASAARLVYLHGFASGPYSSKASLIADLSARFGLALAVPDLNLPTFESLSMDAMVDMACHIMAANRNRTFAMGGSLGAAVLLRALAERRAPNVERAVLLAPVVDHRAALLRVAGLRDEEPWRRSGTLEFQHYAAGMPLPVGYGLIDRPPPLDDGVLARIELPVLLLSAADDTVATEEETTRLLRVLPNATSVTMPTDHQFTRGFDATWAAVSDFFDLRRSEPVGLSGETAANPELRERAELVQEAVSLLCAAYADRSYPPAVHRERLVHEGSMLASVRDERRPGAPMVAVSYVRPDGKVAAVAVDERYRGRGLASRVLRALRAARTSRFIEVERDDERAEHMVLAAGFHPVYDRAGVTDLLASAGHDVTCLGRDRLGVYYERHRRAAGRPGIMRTFTAGRFEEYVTNDLSTETRG
ncbi:YqiA/YcfP family alpha/beta fold hydrolase [Actinomadura monticuli]|uniref:YqiA/YcfP family alpha/beta fold hydrolase n=1 Tax=Actinomadura monticuli TaxID=3097367 RepID=A0ABV4Q9X7_9ACTN